ncbi:short chain dehydrogenase [Roseovarius albus]|uniref:Short chain dehydrogenase n=1 Tax=Roseovarius albus TaxID=1247867 RepID=A0A1X6YRA4_9RHOB|nr:short chain dehydrogenase [Roseovarius albus]
MSDNPGKVLVLGADGFIGRHIAFGLREEGWQVLASARNTNSLSHMGFETLKADLTDPQTHDPDWWRPQIADISHVVIASGVLDASDAVYEAVHVTAPKALCEALPDDANAVLISAVGIDHSETRFARYRQKAEALAQDHNLTVLRAGLVLGGTSYGGSSLARALAAMPFCIPVVGDGKQTFNPIHAADLSRIVSHALKSDPSPTPTDIGGPETITQEQILQSYRRWFGLAPVRALKLPLWCAYLLGKIGDKMRLGPISSTAVAQLQSGVLAKPDFTNLPGTIHPRGFRTFLNARPAGTQDLWHARLYLMRPVLRIVLAVLWLASGLIGLFLPATEFLPLITNAPVSDAVLIALARIGGVADIVLGVLILRGWRPRLTTLLQALLVLGYTAAFTLLAPLLWLLPLGGLLKNLPILALIGILAILEKER